MNLGLRFHLVSILAGLLSLGYAPQSEGAPASKSSGPRLRVEAVKGTDFEIGLVRRMTARMRQAKGLTLSQTDPDYILKVLGKSLPPAKKGQAATHYIVSVSFLANFRDSYKAKLLEVVEKEYKAKTKKFLDSDLVIFSDQILHHGLLASKDAECDALADVFIKALVPGTPPSPAIKKKIAKTP